jgi:hypothetical protein
MVNDISQSVGRSTSRCWLADRAPPPWALTREGRERGAFPESWPFRGRLACPLSTKRKRFPIQSSADVQGRVDALWKGRPIRVACERRQGRRNGAQHMESRKYIGMDVHQASISAAVRDDAGKLVMESVIETKAGTVLEFIRGLRGSLCIAFEEGTSAAWLYELVKPHVAQVVVCDPRKNALLKAGNKNDRVDARKLSELLRAGLLTPVYHGDSGVRTLRELSRSYLTVTKDLTRVMNRTKALYRSWAIPCAGEKVSSARHRSSWLEQLPEAGVRRRAEQLYEQLDAMGSGRPRRASLLELGDVPLLPSRVNRISWRDDLSLRITYDS